MRRADRLFRIVLLLGRGRAVTARELAEALEVSERTIYRDVADLSLSGVPVAGEAGVGYLLRQDYRLPPLMFDAEELAALALGSRMVRGWSDPALGRAAERALLKIEAALPRRLAASRERDALLVPDFHVPPGVAAVLGLLRRALGDGRKVRFTYRRADQAASTRVVWPLGLFFWGQAWTLGGWCELRQEFRTFRLDRMTSVEPLDEEFSGRSLEDYLRLATG